jgi:16S rRNA pseudouridine516 synthase
MHSFFSCSRQLSLLCLAAILTHYSATTLSAFQSLLFSSDVKCHSPYLRKHHGLALIKSSNFFCRPIQGREAGLAKLIVTAKSSESDSGFFLSAEDLLISQGFCWASVNQSDIRIHGHSVSDPKTMVLVKNGINFSMSESSYEFSENIYVALHKPRGFECSRSPQSGKSVLDLLPAHFCARGVQPVGRLDVGTTGLLLLSDDARFIHHVTHPAAEGSPLLKYYRAECASPVTDAQISTLFGGVRLAPTGGGPLEDRVRRCAEVGREGARALRLAISEGAFHQVPPARRVSHSAPGIQMFVRVIMLAISRPSTRILLPFPLILPPSSLHALPPPCSSALLLPLLNP